MNLQDAVAKAGQILDEERIIPTARYWLAAPAASAAAPVVVALSERGAPRRNVQEHPENFIFRSINFDLLCALLDQVPKEDRSAIFAASLSRISNRDSYRHTSQEVLSAGQWRQCSSELPLVAEFNVRRGDKLSFVATLSNAALSPGLTLLLVHLGEMIALDFTLLTDEEYPQIQKAVESIRGSIPNLQGQARWHTPTERNTVHWVCREVPALCDSVSEECRKARYLFLKGALVPGMNFEINQDRGTVLTFLEKLGFTELLIQSLDEAERLYRTGATPFDLKNGLGHLRSFLEQLHLQACAAAQRKFGGLLPSKWGEALKYLRDNAVLSKQEEAFASQFYVLMSDTGVHPLIAEREYARLVRNMSIEYGLLVLTKLDKLGLR
jgi:hypothetical protein